jgi:large subunit ribosomal protein L6
MKKQIIQKIEIPEGVEVVIQEKTLNVSGKEGKISKIFNGKFNISKKDNRIIVGNEKATKKEKKLINTAAAHIKNIINGVQKKYFYTLKVCNVHFPMNIHIDGNEVVVKNFLGEIKERRIKIPEGVEVKINKDIVIISGSDIYKTGQAAANLEKVTNIKYRDRRVFQDGIFIIEKAAVGGSTVA